MKPIHLLQGKWLGHPLHPAVVHLPIGAWIAAAIIDVARRDAHAANGWDHLALYCVILGLVGAVLAVPTGVADWAPIKKEKPAWKLGLVHMALNIVAAVLWAANLGLRWKSVDTTDPVPIAVVVTSVIAALLVLISGYIGSLLVFDHGTSVARQSKKKWRRIAQRGGANLPEES
jgi:uncharacterized membrane protein